MDKKMVWRVIGVVFMLVGIVLKLIFGIENPSVNWIIILAIIVGFFFVVASFILSEKKDLN
jgi:ABC-type iron transport system FetAB permease component